MKPKILILGAGYAGILAANRLEKQVKDAEILLVSESTEFKERIRFHELASSGSEKKIRIKDLLRTNVNFLQSKVTRILPKENAIEIDGNPNFIGYDYLIVSLGSSQIHKIQNVTNSIQSYESTSHFIKKYNEKEILKLGIIGGGLTGIEMASEWKYFHPNSSVFIIDKNEFASSFSAKGKKYLRTYLSQNNIHILEKRKIHSINENEITFEDQNKISFDCILNCSGFKTSNLPSEAGFTTNGQNQIYVDPFLRSLSFQNVFVAGDSAFLENSILRMGCVTALPMGAHIADQIANQMRGKKLSPFLFQFAGRCVSLGRNEGLIQFTYGDDKPKEWIITGKWGALIKELVNRFTIFSLKMEKRLPCRFYFWPKGNPIQKDESVFTKTISIET
ncbi:FAD-dependent oxidoreductase [Leptospira sp. 2 VSF19]|uniref:FAD-dependent oxidoreductase n=1 Tax=Leptospira soteropolitanensis TaxID=2950025 RepID=A0AAW5VJN3_9LEPT|nr:FAD-dependent oxidoreductase [Leptospira soteropolitanensis]MCW7493808.1 FAD-dependent oxidoreductase [Leptospira soteropolitanensis]MCW7501403.1 FAD-dependent oxidoreductase [Leptospira soteropolitanensis]MCW7523834.1 FAD-dependent oxidoreductase [Leptospira soteropolitanensis]MCW7527699.1 FAD-dependent oxidoreductase [Leptospira soteropolitanensis]MCW7531552.1 FAD-dependent oxidoreductase [Leptospira soteropolitanensis]